MRLFSKLVIAEIGKFLGFKKEDVSIFDGEIEEEQIRIEEYRINEEHKKQEARNYFEKQGIIPEELESHSDFSRLYSNTKPTKTM